MKKTFAIVLSVILAGCSAKPSDGEIESQVIPKIRDNFVYPDKIQIERFEKFNGFQKDEKTYVADLEYVIGAKGETGKKEYKAKATFLKTEKGWLISDFKITDVSQWGAR